jgi:hypothetical protein
LSEQLALNSIADTLAVNMPTLSQLKILIDGQEATTLAGHIDLTGSFVLQTPATAPAPVADTGGCGSPGPKPDRRSQSGAFATRLRPALTGSLLTGKLKR